MSRQTEGQATKVKVIERTVSPRSRKTGSKSPPTTKGLITIEPYGPLYAKTQCSVAAGVHQASEPGKPFGIFVANFTTKPVVLTPGQVVATTDEHPAALMETDMSHGEMLG